METTHPIFCEYAVVRFMPFVETREFANVGVVLIAPDTGRFLFKLAPSRFSRVTQFFDDLDGRVYKKARDNFNGELERLQRYVAEQALFGRHLAAAFGELTRYRESLMHFGSVGRLLSTDVDAEIDLLYERFVARAFVTPEYREDQMAAALKTSLLHGLQLNFVRKKLYAEGLEISVPLASETDSGVKVIKPLAFTQHSPLKAYEHGKNWLGRIERLVKTQALARQNALFATEAPDGSDPRLTQVYAEVVDEIEHSGMKAIDFNRTDDIVDYMRQ